MTEIPLHIRPADESAVDRIDAAIVEQDLVATMKGTLKSYPGCKHWHCKRGTEMGTLEITLWPAKRRAWFKIQSSRRAPWMDDAVSNLKRALEG